MITHGLAKRCLTNTTHLRGIFCANKQRYGIVIYHFRLSLEISDYIYLSFMLLVCLVSKVGSFYKELNNLFHFLDKLLDHHRHKIQKAHR